MANILRFIPITCLLLFSLSFSKNKIDSLFNETLTDSLFTNAIATFTQTATVNASIKRFQTYKGMVRESAGTFKYDRTQGAVYLYNSPSKFQVTCTDSILYSIDPEKKQGFRFNVTPQDPLKYYDLDPINRFFTFFSKLNGISFLGSIDSTLIFCKENEMSHKPGVSIGIDNQSKKVTLIEFFDAAAHLRQQVIFEYGSDKLPTIAVSKMILGGEILTDSLVLRYKKADRKLPSELFVVPGNIDWKTAH
jgi:hypothetical protein